MAGGGDEWAVWWREAAIGLDGNGSFTSAGARVICIVLMGAGGLSTVSIARHTQTPQVTEQLRLWGALGFLEDFLNFASLWSCLWWLGW
ncbi:hypothetical protein Tco_0478490 [Tanacetum coccineum]